MSNVFANRVLVSTATTGTGTVTLGAALAGYRTFASAGIANAAVVRYLILDGNAWEIGTGTYTASGTTLSRTVQESSAGGTTAISLTGGARVAVIASAQDYRALNRTGLRTTYGGTENAITLTTGAGISGTPPTGLELRFLATAANTGAATIALDGGSAIACRTITGVALPLGYIRTDADTIARYDGTFWVLERQVQRGSNANGEFVRFADGTQICTRRLTVDAVDISTATGSLFLADLGNYTLPATFINVDYVSADVLGSNNVTIRGNAIGARLRRASTSVSTAGIDWNNLAVYSSVSATAAAGELTQIVLFATGRWF